MPANHAGVNIFAGSPPLEDHLTGTTGAVFYVGSTAVPGGVAGVDSAEVGQRPQQPYATINYAVTQCVAGRGDRVYVLPGHNESLTAATSCVIDKAGVSVLGIGHGQNRPILDFDNTAATIEMDAASTRLSNVVLRASVSAVVVGINVDANDCEIDHIETTWEETGDDFLTMIDIDAVDRCTVRDCKLYTEPATVGSAEGIRVDDAHNTRILRNEIVGNFSDSPIAGEGAASTECLVLGNLLYNSDTTDNNGMEWVVASTGLMAYNAIGTLAGGSAVTTLLDPGSFLCIENYAVNAIDEGAIRLPATTPT